MPLPFLLGAIFGKAAVGAATKAAAGAAGKSLAGKSAATGAKSAAGHRGHYALGSLDSCQREGRDRR